MSTTITPTEQNIEINVNNDVIDINVTNEIVDVNATTQQIDINVAGAYPLPNAVLSVFGRTGQIVATEGDYTLTQLGDVTLTSPTNGQVLKYNGTTWVNGTDSGTVTSVAITETGDALTITGSPITTSGTINIAFAGTGAQYVKGDGTLATFPTTIAQAERLITEVYNRTGATLTKGTVVYINGGQGNLPTVTKALATGDSTSAQTFGVVQADITNMNNGYVVVAGKLSDLDTQAYTEGTQLYLSATTAGAWTSTKQYAPNHLVYIGIVVRAHPTQGIVEVKIQNGYEMDELHNVAAQTPSNNDGLFWESATNLWKNKSIATILGYTPQAQLNGTGFVKASGTSITYDNSTYVTTDTFQNISSSKTFDVGFNLASAGGTNQLTNFVNTNSIHSGSAGINVLGFNNSNNIYFGKGLNNGGVIQWNNSTVRYYTLPDADGTIALVGGSGVGTVTSVGLSSATSGVTIGSSPITTSGTITLAIATASGSQQGLLSSTDWTTFNNKQNALTNPVTGTGTSGQVAYFNGTSSITSESNLFWDTTNDRLGIGTATPNYVLTALYSTSGQNGIRLRGSNASAQTQLFIENDLSTGFLIGVTGSSIATYGANTANQGVIYSTAAITLMSDGSIIKFASGGNTERMRLFTTGNLGINTTTDAGFRLDVNGTARVQGTTTISGDNNLIFQRATDGNSLLGIEFRGSGGAERGAFKINLSTGELRIGATNFGGFFPTFYTNGIEGGRFTTAGTFQTTASITAASAIARGVYFNNTLVAAANNDVLVGLDINPTFTNGAFTNVANVPIRLSSVRGGFMWLGATTTGNSGVGFQAYQFTTNDTTNVGTMIVAQRNASGSGTALQVQQLGTGLAFNVSNLGSSLFNSSITASGAIARGVRVENTLVAAANNDVLVGLDINPTFTNGAFTGVANYGIRYNSSNAITPFYFQSTSSGTAYTTNTIGGNNTFTIASRDILTTNFVLLNGSNGVNLYTYNNALTLDRIGTNSFFTIINQNVAIGTTTNAGFRLDVNGTTRSQSTLGVGILSAVSGTPTATPSTTGGTLAAATYFYRIVAVDPFGNTTTGSTEVSATTTGTTSSVALSWSRVNGAASYRIYRGTATGAQTLYYTSTGTTYTDTNAASTAGTVPTINSTYQVQLSGGISIAQESASIINTNAYSSNIFTVKSVTGGTDIGGMIINTGTGESRFGSFRVGGGYYTAFFVNNAELIRLSASNNVLIGTTTDSGFKLDVNGTARVQGAITGTSTLTLNGLLNNSSNEGRFNYLATGGAAANTSYGITVGAGRGIILQSGGNTVIDFANGSSNNLTLRSNTTNLNSFGALVFGNTTTDKSFFTMDLISNTALFADSIGIIATSIQMQASALVAMNSTTKGFLPPRMTTTQKTAITTPATGLVVYDTTLNKLSVYTGSAWETVTSV